jgi:hypothetical protein
VFDVVVDDDFIYLTLYLLSVKISLQDSTYCSNVGYIYRY